MKTIDVTPTWGSLLKVFIAVLQDGTAEGQKQVKDELSKMAKVVDDLNVKMPNGVDSWQETHYEVVEYLTNTQGIINTGTMAEVICETEGRGGLYEKAEELTTEFETLNKGRVWDGEFYDEIQAFLERKEHAYSAEPVATGRREVDEANAAEQFNKPSLVLFLNDDQSIREIQRGRDGARISVGMETKSGKILSIEKDDNFTGGMKAETSRKGHYVAVPSIVLNDED